LAGQYFVAGTGSLLSRMLWKWNTKEYCDKLCPSRHYCQ